MGVNESPKEATLSMVKPEGYVMKRDCRCPKCEGHKLYIVEPVSMPAQNSVNGTESITIGAAYIKDSDKKGWFGGAGSAMVAAQCKAYVCASCGYTEWYTTGLDSLEKLAVSPRHTLDTGKKSSRVRIIAGTQPTEQ